MNQAKKTQNGDPRTLPTLDSASVDDLNCPADTLFSQHTKHPRHVGRLLPGWLVFLWTEHPHGPFHYWTDTSCDYPMRCQTWAPHPG